MLDEPDQSAQPKPALLPASQVVMCVLCLAVGILAGYFLRGSASPAAPAVESSSAAQPRSQLPAESASQSPTAQGMASQMPSLDDLKRMADMKAAPLLEKLKSDPRNAQLENQVGLVYEDAHQFKVAAGYFEKSLESDPKNVGVRADYASCLYYTGDVDGALAQLNQSLVYDPTHPGTLMNIGIIKWQAKKDVGGAVAAWEKLLKYNPGFPQKDLVQHMITQAKQQAKSANEGQKG